MIHVFRNSEVKRIIDFCNTKDGKVEYIAELANGQKKYLTRKMIINQGTLFEKVV
jgi:hypothetical protein